MNDQDEGLFPAAGGLGGEIGIPVTATLDALGRPVVPAVVEPKASVNQQKEQAERWKKRISYFLSQQKDHAKRWKRNRQYANFGGDEDDGEPGLVRVNLVASTVNTIQPNIYAKAPEVAVEPEERVDQNDYKQVRPFAQTLEIVLNRYAIKGTNLKARGKEAVRSALTCTTGWVKVIYQNGDKREDPLIRNRINDAQDNILRIQSLVAQTKEHGQTEQYEAKMAELHQLIAALEAKVEIKAAEGLVIDNVQPEHILILDASVSTIDEYAQASAIAHGIYMTVGAYKAQFGNKEPPKKAKRYSATEHDDSQAGPDSRGKTGIDADDELVRVWEIWSKDDMTVYTLCDGADEYCRDPYQPEMLGQVWYPFFPLQLWRITGNLYARCLVDNIIELTDEYNTRRTVAVEHRKKNMPVRLLNKASGITDEELEKINNRGPSTNLLGITADPQNPLQNQLGSLPEIPYNPAMYDTQDIMRDIEMVSGAQDASRGAVTKVKTATEAEIQSQGMQGKTAEQIDSLEDWLQAILSYSAQLLLLNLTPELVKSKFGESAVWPALSRAEVYEQVSVNIRAGSTAKPNKMRERDQWIQFLPQMNDAIGKISELEQAGQTDLADAMKKLIDETLRRFDERLSIEEFLPSQDEGDGKPNMSKMLAMAKQKIQEMSQEAEQGLAQQRDQLAKQTDLLKANETALEVRTIEFNALQQVDKVKSEYLDKLREVENREVSDKIINEVKGLLLAHEQKVVGVVQDLQPGPDEIVNQVREEIEGNREQLETRQNDLQDAHDELQGQVKDLAAAPPQGVEQ